MCLETLQTEPLVALEDITVYKVVYKQPFSGRYTGPYINEFEYTFDTTLEAELRMVRGDDGDLEHHVFEGFHSFADWGGFHLGYMIGDFPHRLDRYYMVKCTIPRGAEYYKGTFAELEGYTSTELIMHSATLIQPFPNRMQ